MFSLLEEGKPLECEGTIASSSGLSSDLSAGSRQLGPSSDSPAPSRQSRPSRLPAASRSNTLSLLPAQPRPSNPARTSGTSRPSRSATLSIHKLPKIPADQNTWMIKYLHTKNKFQTVQDRFKINGSLQKANSSALVFFKEEYPETEPDLMSMTIRGIKIYYYKPYTKSDGGAYAAWVEPCHETAVCKPGRYKLHECLIDVRNLIGAMNSVEVLRKGQPGQEES